ncbi:MAG: exonuclease SbcCD subunit D C-terminal domain-containing protein [Deltaproteobacteria bacterium]|jgi:exonuclease SbcD|nr:exonuclease SbcCD subunit D C-terminal domain-containing protein [Deltaproteobacteria bacterium]
MPLFEPPVGAIVRNGRGPSQPSGKEGGPKPKGALRVLHTSDWHLGKTLGKVKRRHEEHRKFLDWLLGVIESEGVDVLLVAGDVFDTIAPPVEAQGLYYAFLARAMRGPLRHAVITSGNHDSQAFLSAPRELLRHLGAHVVAEPTENPGDEVISLNGPGGAPELIVAAVPFLKDRALLQAVEGEDQAARDARLAEAVSGHYLKVAEIAGRLAKGTPVVAMGHLFARGGKVGEGGGEREPYVGSLSRIDAARSFPGLFAYVALGHLHSAQSVGSDRVRYSGSPIGMGFEDGGASAKSVTILDIGPDGLEGFRELRVPTFQELLRVKGDLRAIEARISKLKAEGSAAWLEIVQDLGEPLGDPGLVFGRMVEGSSMEILAIKDQRAMDQALRHEGQGRKLKEYTVPEVFERALDAHKVEDPAKDALRETFGMVLQMFEETGGDLPEGGAGQ